MAAIFWAQLSRGGPTLVKHVVNREQKTQERVLFHASSRSTRTVLRIAISCNFGKKGILFSSTSWHLGYEFQRHESSLYLPPFCRLLWHFYTFSHSSQFNHSVVLNGLSYRIARLFDSFVPSQSMIEGTTSIDGSKWCALNMTAFISRGHRWVWHNMDWFGGPTMSTVLEWFVIAYHYVVYLLCDYRSTVLWLWWLWKHLHQWRASRIKMTRRSSSKCFIFHTRVTKWKLNGTIISLFKNWCILC